MKELIKKRIAESIRVKETLVRDQTDNIENAATMIIEALKNGGKVLIFGNGGSAADSQHIAAELVGRFRKERKALAAIALTANSSTVTALANDYGFDAVFSRQIEALGQKGDVALGISTSGRSKNVVNAIEKAKKMGLKTIGLAGGDKGALQQACDCLISVDSPVTARVQEAHITIGHIICELVEDGFSKK